ncbi:2-dehydro-3-deoxygalactonokinase [Thalassomonas sp. M1454]|uniref:2-dehydro-3-deoxygalactonokinase n=1 Tax=Thalassomonas sp. M1454 TaxID=2594477 RepID=UPI001180825D|nr:2-dehydro-3-deoxygalactonokinase [Thalassomonas sp. M1454]TRX57989.1 2-dehydro-3-deoxygalactonokinase [Thalassomonas sp. M1454]
MSKIQYLIIDWGTTNFRAFAVDENTQVVSQKELSLGLLNVKDGNFAKALEDILTDWIEDYASLPLYMAGMVGSLKGWVNVDYATTPCSIENIVAKAYHFDSPWGAKATIFPGVSHQYDGDKFDVMRGEEVQLFGLSALLDKTNSQDTQNCIVLPGTHSKHAIYDHGISEFSSYMTGELFSLLSKHSLIATREKNEEFERTVFLDGIKDAQSGEFSNRVFLAWTNRVFKKYHEAQMEDYLSGLLIGFELRNIKKQKIYFIGGEPLCQRYQLAAESLGKDTQYFSGNECFLAGMNNLISGIKK